MLRPLPNIPLSVDPNSKNQPDVNRQLTEAIRQLTVRVNDLDKRLSSVEYEIGQMKINIDRINSLI